MGGGGTRYAKAQSKAHPTNTMTAATVALLACTAVTGAVATCPCPAWCLPDQSGHQPLPGTITVSLSPGAANCTTIQGALELTRQGYRGRYTIEIAPGIYNEKVVVMANRPPVTLVGRTEEVDGVVVRWQDCDGCSTPTDPLGYSGLGWDFDHLFCIFSPRVALDLGLISTMPPLGHTAPHTSYNTCSSSWCPRLSRADWCSTPYHARRVPCSTLPHHTCRAKKVLAHPSYWSLHLRLKAAFYYSRFNM